MTRYLLFFCFFVSSGLVLGQQGWYQYTTLNSQISGNDIRKVCPALDGSLWIITENGVSHFKNGNFSNYNSSNGLLSSQVEVIYQDENQQIWLGYGASSVGVSMFDGISFQHFNTSSTVDLNIFSIASIGSRLYFGSDVNQIRVKNGSSFSSLFESFDFITDYQDDKIILMRFTNTNFLQTFNGASFEKLLLQGSNFLIKSGFADNGELFLNLKNGAFSEVQIFKNDLWQVESATYHNWELTDALDGAIDKYNNYWLFNPDVSEYYGVVLKYDGSSLAVYNTVNGFDANYINDLEVNDESLFLATDNGLVIGSIYNQDQTVAQLAVNNLYPHLSAIGNIGGRDISGEHLFEHKSGEKLLFSSKLWFGGIDNSGTLYACGERYPFFRNEPGESFPGPVSDNQLPKLTNGRVWNISRGQIDYHKANYNQVGYYTPDVIASWPAHGNPQYGEEYCLAPFVDNNDNGLYEPKLGDYPEIRGDQAIYTIYNDSRGSHDVTGGDPMQIEVHMMAYAFAHWPELENTIFVNYNLYNRSGRDYSNFYAGQWADFDLGNPFDDYIGCDSTLDLYYAYNGETTDLPYSSGGISGNGFGNNPPSIGITYLEQEMSSFISFDQDTALITGAPRNELEYYNMLLGKWRDGEPMVNSGNGYPAQNTPPFSSTAYMYSGDPETSTWWTELNENNTPGDRRGIGAIGPFDFHVGERFSIDLAFVYARANNSTHIANVTHLKQAVQVVKKSFENMSFNDPDKGCETTGLVDDFLKEDNDPFLLYPNPSEGYITIRSFDKIQRIQITTIEGREVKTLSVNSTNQTINLSYLPKGIYSLTIWSEDSRQIKKLILQ